MVGDNKTYKEPGSDFNLNLGGESDDNLDKKTEEKLSNFIEFVKRYQRVIITVLIIILTIIVLFIIDRNLKTIHLTLPTDGLLVSYQTDNNGKELPTDTPIRLVSYNADAGAPGKILYYIDTIATVYPDSETLSVSWKVPNEARYRSTYTELCVLDNDKQNKDVDGYCKGIGGSSIAYEAVYTSTTDIYSDSYNKISCSYYVSAHSVGLTASLSGWNKLSEDQLVGCAGSANQNNVAWGDESFMDSVYGIYGFSTTLNNGLTPNTGISGLTMENLFQSIINGNGGRINAADVVRNSFTDNFSYNSSTQQIDLSTTGVLSGESCNLTFNRNYSRPAPVNGTDNTTVQTYSCIPVFNVDKYGRITSVSAYWISYDATVGNEIVGVYGMHSGLTRHGSGTANDPYTISVNTERGLLIDDNNNIEVHIGGWQNNGRHSGLEFTSDGVLRVNAPEECNNVDNTVLGWDDENYEFSCITFTDNYGINTDYKNTVITRTGDVIDYNLGETGVIDSNSDYYDSSHIASADDDAKDINAGSTYESNIEKLTYQIPRLTVDKYGRLLSTGTTDAFTLSVGAGMNMDEDGNITVDQGFGLTMLCPIYDSGSIVGYNNVNCAEKDKQLVINIGGENNNGAGSGLEFTGDGILRINSPEDCNNIDNTVLGWDDDNHEFSCITFTDNLGIDTNYQNTVITRNGDVIDYNLGETGVIDSNSDYYSSSHIPSASDGAKDVNAGSTYKDSIEKITYQIPRLTVDKYGRLLSTGTTDAFTISVGAGMNMDESGNITIDQGIGLIMLCPIYDSGNVVGYTDNNCDDKDKQLVINIGGDNNTGTGSGESGLTINQYGRLTVNTGNGLTINSSNNKVEINAPTCSNMKNTAGDANSNGANVTSGQAGRLVWDGTSFKCEMISTQTNQSFGNNAKALSSDGTLTLGSVATITVNPNGELTFGTATLTIKDGAGITVISDGTISLPGITDNTAMCNASGQGLFWNGNSFACRVIYTWNLQAAGTNQTTISAGGTVNFTTGGGLTVSKGASNNTVSYTLNLSVLGSGLTINNTNGTIGLINCNNGQVLKATSAANGWTCGDDDNTTYSAGEYIDISNNVVSGRLKTKLVHLGQMSSWNVGNSGRGVFCGPVVNADVPGTVVSATYIGAYSGFFVNILLFNQLQGCYLGDSAAGDDGPQAFVIYYE